jgi:hypothetical protein
VHKQRESSKSSGQMATTPGAGPQSHAARSPPCHSKGSAVAMPSVLPVVRTNNKNHLATGAPASFPTPPPPHTHTHPLTAAWTHLVALRTGQTCVRPSLRSGNRKG